MKLHHKVVLGTALSSALTFAVTGGLYVVGASQFAHVAAFTGVLSATLSIGWCVGMYLRERGKPRDLLDGGTTNNQPDTKFAFGMLRLFVRGKERRRIEGDLLQEYTDDILPEYGPRYARGWLIWHVLLVGGTQIKQFLKDNPVSGWFKKTGGSSRPDGDDNDDTDAD